MSQSAKEGSRTPTRVTPLEPEGTESSGNLQTIRNVSAVLWVNMRPQNAAGNSRPPQDNGARTASGIPDFDHLSGPAARQFWERLRVPSWLYSVAAGQPRRSPVGIYFIEAVGAERIKVGFTIDLEQRIKGLRVGSPFPLRVLLVVDGTEHAEQYLHEQRLAPSRVHGEWFHADAVRKLIGSTTLYWPRLA